MIPVRHLAVLAVTVLAAGALGAQQARPDGAFIVRLGTDTIAVERFTRQGSAWGVEQVRRVPRTTLWHTHLELSPAGEIGTIFLMNHALGAPPSAPLLGSTKLTWSAGDSATVETRRGDSLTTRRAAVRRGMIPSLPQSWLAYELAAMRLRAAGADSLPVTFLGPAGNSTPVVVRRLGADSMTFALPQLEYRARVDAQGRILSLYLPRSTTVERVPDVDVTALAAAWSAADAAGRGMGQLSPLDSTAARVGDASISVRYSRPRLRGRVIFGNLEPWDVVWRTGANAATVLTTDRNLVIGTAQVPAGSYSVFTIPSRSGTTLILNRETMRGGQPLGGTDYDPAHDLARIPMTTTTLPAPVEQLTIEILPRGADNGILRVAWDRREMTVPIRPGPQR